MSQRMDNMEADIREIRKDVKKLLADVGMFKGLAASLGAVAGAIVSSLIAGFKGH